MEDSRNPNKREVQVIHIDEGELKSNRSGYQLCEKLWTLPSDPAQDQS